MPERQPPYAAASDPDGIQSFLPARSERESIRNTPIRLFTKSPKGLQIRDHRVRRLARRFRKAFGWLTDADGNLLRAYCRVEILTEELFAKIRVDGISRDDGRPHYLLSEFRSLTRVGADLAGRLGLSPRDRATMQAASTAAPVLDLRAVREAEDAEPEN